MCKSNMYQLAAQNQLSSFQWFLSCSNSVEDNKKDKYIVCDQLQEPKEQPDCQLSEVILFVNKKSIIKNPVIFIINGGHRSPVLI